MVSREINLCIRQDGPQYGKLDAEENDLGYKEQLPEPEGRIIPNLLMPMHSHVLSSSVLYFTLANVTRQMKAMC